ncbi:hypothetical protein DXB51_00105 [Bacillus cereus]|uniref:AAA family ATPase n=1 Tax=Bacillus luti TaxID=2026191 RepID=A0ABU8HNI7_9BACI|nr:AAA family ATPase [Bacillus luti]RGN80698.1 hypothetical protein DXB51_00105 [Bacillus cereus]
MQLLYLWVDRYKNIKRQGFAFSGNHEISTIQDDRFIQGIHITEKKDEIRLFGSKITGITGIIGKNGSGKTNVLDIIGMQLDKRRANKTSGYFLLYKQSQTKYVIEGNKIELIEPFTHGLGDSQYIHNPYSIVVSYDKENGTFKFNDFLQEKEKQASSLVVLSAKRQESSSNAIRLLDNSYLFQRIALKPSSIGYYSKYKMLIDFNNISFQEKRLFHAKNRIYLKIRSNLEYFHDNRYPLKLKIIQPSNGNWMYSNFKEEVLKANDRKTRWLLVLTEEYIQFTWSYLVKSLNENGEEGKIFSILKNIEDIEVVAHNAWGYYDEVLSQLMGELWNCLNEYAVGQDVFYSAYNELIMLLLDLPEEVFKENEIKVSIGDIEQEEIKNLLQKLDSEYLKENSPNLLNNIFRVEFYPFSSGEEAYLNLFATLYFGISVSINQPKKALLILLDEPDQFMHPEWCRQFIWEFLQFLKQVPNGYTKYQIIFTTHSPFLVSDLPNSHVITLEKNQETGDCVVLEKLTGQTFASNIHTLLADKFFLYSTTGELAFQTINLIIKQLNKSRSLGRNEEKRIYSLINLVGEPIIKQRLLEMYHTKFPSNKELRIKELMSQKERIQFEIDALDGEDI